MPIYVGIAVTHPQRLVVDRASPTVNTDADITVWAGGDASWLVNEHLKYVHHERFHGVIFRRTYKQITEVGGLWDETLKVYPHVGGVPKCWDMRWQFPSGATMRCRSIEDERDWIQYQGMQAPLLCFDRAEQFASTQFWRLLCRNRSSCGIKPRTLLTCSANDYGFLADLVEWWLDEQGRPIPERNGIVRYFAGLRGDIVWADSREELIGMPKPDPTDPHACLDYAVISTFAHVKSFTLIS